MANCASGKKLYLSEDMAIEALKDIWIRTDFTAGGGPVGVYGCGDCGHFHLTSKGEMNVKLKDYLTTADYRARHRAAGWERKFR